MPCAPGLRARPPAPLAILLAVLVVASVASSCQGAAPAGAAPRDRGARPVAYRPPVDDPVTEPFDLPPQPWMAGNRGVDHHTRPGTWVRTAAPGVVSFAGPVAGALHVTVTHADGLRTSYSFLESVAVARGQRLDAGAVVGTSGPVLHWGVRDPAGNYLDPMALLARPVTAVLVPGGDDGAVAPDDGGGWLALAGAVRDGIARHGTDVLGRSLSGLDGFTAWAHQVIEARPEVHAVRLITELPGRILRDCTEDDVPTPAADRRRIAVLVGGFGSTSDHAGIDGLDAHGLGYAADDVVRFSYGGGRTPGPPGATGPLAGLTTSTYDARTSQRHLDESAAAMAALLAEVAARQPGVPIDVFAHSQGGLVTRLALDRAAAAGTLPSEVDLVATFGTPHRGADMATLAASLDGTAAGGAVLEAGAGVGLPVHTDQPAIGQLAETSDQVAAVADSPPPEGVRLLSVAARGDLTVPSPRSRVVGGTEVVVDLVGPSAHDQVAGHPQSTREVALARAGMAPGCEGWGEVVADLVAGEAVTWAESGIGATLGAGARAVQAPPLPSPP